MTTEEAIDLIKQDALYNPEVAKIAIEALEFEEKFVKCKDCRFYSKNRDWFIEYKSNEMICNGISDEGYCSVGRRKR